jgi:hypothetical protein
MRRWIIATLVGGILALSTVAGAFAFHPGVGNGNNPDHEMPQGPAAIACEKSFGNPSGHVVGDDGWGVYNAIDHGGMVHCDEGEFED